MAKGAESKLIVANKILETFTGSFLYNDGKEIRIPLVEDGEVIQIKVALTCAKECVEMGADHAKPGDFPTPSTAAPTPARETPVAPTEDEKRTVAEMLRKLGL